MSSTQYWLLIAVAAVTLPVTPVIFLGYLKPSRTLIVLAGSALVVFYVALLQSQDWSSDIVGPLSPAVSAAYLDWIPETLAGDQSSIPASVCPSLTRQAALMPFLFATMLLLGGLLFGNSRNFVALLGITASSGFVLSLLALLDSVRAVPSEGAQHWITPDIFGSAPFASFVNKNNAACYLNLACACSVGLIAKFSMNTSELKGNADGLVERKTLFQKARFSVATFLNGLDAVIATWGVMLIVLVVAILVSSSRGGCLATVAGLVVVGFQTRMRRVIFVLMITTVCICIAGYVFLIFLNLDGQVETRVASIFSISAGSQVGRLNHCQDAFYASLPYLPAGAGFGTYQFAYLPYQRIGSASHFVNADCMPLEWLVEGGVWLVGIIAFAWVLAWKTVCSGTNLAFVVTGRFTLASLAVSQLFDFGINLPCNYLLTALMVGAICENIRRERQRESDNNLLDSQVGAARWSFSAMILMTSLLVGFPLAYRHALLAKNAQQLSDQLNDGVQELKEHLSKSEQASNSLNGNSVTEIDHTSGLKFNSVIFDTNQFLHANDFPSLVKTYANSLFQFQQLHAWQIAKVEKPDSKRSKLKRLTPIPIRRAIFYITKQQGQQNIKVDDVLLPGQQADSLRQLREVVIKSLQTCPLSYELRSAILITSFVNPISPETIEDVRLHQQLVHQSASLWPLNADVLENIVRLSAPYPGVDTTSPWLARIIELNPDRIKKIWPIIQSLGSVEEMLECFPSDAEAICVAIEQVELPPELKIRLVDRAEDLLRSEDFENSGIITSGRAAYLLAGLSSARGEHVKAIEFMKTVVRDDPSNLEYRIQLAELLVSADELELAVEQLQRCLLQNPNHSSAQTLLRRLLKRLNVRQ